MKPQITLAALLIFAGLSQAASISVNFTESTGHATQQMASTTAAGFNGAMNWNNVAGPADTQGSLLDSEGSATAATVSWAGGGGAWGDGQANGDAAAEVGNAQLRRGYLDDNGATPPMFTVTGIPFANYNLVIYYSTDSTYANSSQYQGATANGVYARPGFSDIENRYGSNPNFDSTNTLTFGGLSGDLSLQMDARNTTGTGRATIAGFQVIGQVPEPSAPLLGGLAGMVMLLRRRR